MQRYRCQAVRGPLDASISVRGSKSITNRAMVAAGLADGTSVLEGILLADDTRLMIDALRALGIAVTVDEPACSAEVTGCRGLIPVGDAKVSCGNAGTVMRFVTAMAALGRGRYELDGVERMRQRPIGALVDVLRTLGAGVEFPGADGYPPVVVHARGLGGGDVLFNAPDSSQFVSATLLAAPCAGSDVRIEVKGSVPSAPYLKMTTSVMDHFGVAVLSQYDDHGAKFVVAAPQRYAGRTYAIEPDASNASYFLAAPAIVGGRVTVNRLGTDSIQGDARFVDVLERMGCRIERGADTLTVHGPPKGMNLAGIDIDLNAMPDMVQTLAVVALFAEDPTTIRNVANLRVKETDRLAALDRELTKLGAVVHQQDDGLRITPPTTVRPATVDTYDDHRMAMSFALVGIKCPGVVINDPQCCGKTFPEFFERLEEMTVEPGSG